jgi:hypothetical protein
LLVHVHPHLNKNACNHTECNFNWSMNDHLAVFIWTRTCTSGIMPILLVSSNSDYMDYYTLTWWPDDQ